MTTSPPPKSDRILTLQVCEHHFTTRASTLMARSTYFASLLSGRWSASILTNDSGRDSIFIDADGDTFEHILRYLRTDVMPLFYNASHGFDLNRYSLLHEAADFFGVNALADWIEKEQYLKAVQLRYIVDEVEAVQGDNGITTVTADEEQQFFPEVRIKKIYVCPRGIPVHEGKPRACGEKCMKARGTDDVEYRDDEVLTAVRVTKRTIFKRDICKPGGSREISGGIL